jgi:hypothetical protein
MIPWNASEQREAMWVSLDGRVFEHLRLGANKDGVMADGLIIHLDQTNSFRLRYRINCDSAWQVRRVEINRLDENSNTLVLHSNGKGDWTNAQGERIPQLNECRDIDIYYSPFTNTLAIRRLALRPGETGKIDVAFINVPDLKVSAVQQRYTLLRATPEGGLYRYESLASGFTTELPVDSDGLVIEYPRFFRRIWTR